MQDQEVSRPRVGVGLYVVKDGKVLMGKRRSEFESGTWCAPGGKLEWGEDPKEAAIREAYEEAGITVKNVRFVGYTNDIGESSHYVTLQFRADWESGEPQLMEPDKFEDSWHWADWNNLPQPLFMGFRTFVENGFSPF